jgi:lipoprotein-anchoring transpeptidase ErfK/SrfK
MKLTILPVVRWSILALAAAAPLAALDAKDVQLAQAQVERPRIETASLQAEQVQAPRVADSLGETSTFLAAGQFIWKPDPAASGPVKIVVSIPLQLAYVFKGSTLIATSSVSTGAPGYDTPVGSFTILQKKVDHKSTLYDDAPMPFMQRLTWDGVALHAGKVTGQPASHGCVRLPAAFAKKLYGETSLGAQVVIVDEAPMSAEQAYAALPPADLLASR